MGVAVKVTFVPLQIVAKGDTAILTEGVTGAEMTIELEVKLHASILVAIAE